MKHLHQAPRPVELDQKAVDEWPLPPSSDQEAFNRSLRAGVRSLGALVRSRRKEK